MGTTHENPLLQLSAKEQQQLVDVVKDTDIDKLAEETGLTRRQVIMAGVGLAVGTAAGGITAQELIQEASAAASTTDGDGNVGLPNDRVDVFAESGDFTSVITDPSGKSHTGEMADVADTLDTTDVNSANWDDYEIQKNGTDGSGIINFKT